MVIKDTKDFQRTVRDSAKALAALSNFIILDIKEKIQVVPGRNEEVSVDTEASSVLKEKRGSPNGLDIGVVVRVRTPVVKENTVSRV